MKLMTLPGVFRPRADSWLLADVVRDHRLAVGARVLDVFTGSGVLALAAARSGARAVTAVDVLRRAVATVRLNAAMNGVQLRAVQGDAFGPVHGERFDLIVANPPYLPDANGRAAHGKARAWSAGPHGRHFIDRFCAEAGDHLAPDGTIALVHSSFCNTPLTLAALADRGFDATVAERRRGPLGPLATAQARVMEDRGMLRPGERSEELHVIVARRSAAV